MVPTSYTELFIFLVGAVGAALFFGTGAALLRFRRTGAFPGEDPTQAQQTTRPLRGVITRCALGAVVLASSLGALTMVRI